MSAPYFWQCHVCFGGPYLYANTTRCINIRSNELACSHDICEMCKRDKNIPAPLSTDQSLVSEPGAAASSIDSPRKSVANDHFRELMRDSSSSLADLICPFQILHCDQEFHTIREWKTHVFSHFLGQPCPRHAICFACDREFSQEINNDSSQAWNEMLSHLAQVHSPLHQACLWPDFDLMRWMHSRNLISTTQLRMTGDLNQTKLQATRRRRSRSPLLRAISPAPISSDVDSDTESVASFAFSDASVGTNESNITDYSQDEMFSAYTDLFALIAYDGDLRPLFEAASASEGLSAEDFTTILRRLLKKLAQDLRSETLPRHTRRQQLSFLYALGF